MTFAKTMAAAAFGAAMIVGSASSHAALITREFTFTASNFVFRGEVPATSPFNTITGSFRVTFDRDVDAQDQTSDITLLSLSDGINPITLGSPIAFTHIAGLEDEPLFVGGAENGTNDVAGSGFDFTVGIIDPSSDSPQFTAFLYRPAGGTVPFEGFNLDMTFVDLTVDVAEPASLALFAAGLVALRRRRGAR